MRRAFSLIAMMSCASVAACVPNEAPVIAAVQAEPQPPAPPPRITSQVRADARIARAMDQLAASCGALRIYVLGAQLVGNPKRRAAMEKAGIVLDRLCNDPPRDVASALASAAEAYAAIQALEARR